MMPLLRSHVYPKPPEGTPLRDGVPFRIMAGMCSKVDRLEAAIYKIQQEMPNNVDVAEENPDATRIP